MQKLRLSFAGRRVEGSGTDIVGPFVLSGLIADDGAVVMRKQYTQRHSVDYFGNYDGEGTMTGEWRLAGMRGRWMISIRRFDADPEADAVEIIASE